MGRGSMWRGSVGRGRALEEARGEREHWERELRRESVGRGGEGAWMGEGAWGGGALGDRERGVRGSVFQMWGL